MKFFEDFRELGERGRFRAPEDWDPASTWTSFSNPVCGDELEVSLEIRQGQVGKLKYRSRGCWPVAAAAELLFDWADGRDPVEIISLPVGELLSWVEGVPAGKRHAFSLVHRGLVWSVAQGYRPDAVGPESKERLY